MRDFQEYPKTLHGWNEDGERITAVVNDATAAQDAMAAGWSESPTKKPGAARQKVKSVIEPVLTKEGKPDPAGRKNVIHVADLSEDEDEAPTAAPKAKPAKKATPKKK